MRFILFFLILGLFPPTALAEAPLVFRNAAKDAREQDLLQILKSTGDFTDNFPYMIAAVDLNDDGVEEWIFRQDRESGCMVNAACPYVVAGLSEGKLVTLGAFSARKVGISDQKSYGVNRLYVYNIKENDFAYSMYGWSPQNGRFQPL